MLIVKKIYDSASGTLEIPSEVLPENGLPFSHHFTSTPGDNLIELAGRVCYDSAQMEKTRGTVEYHKHINEVNHGSTQEHLNITYDAWFHAMIASDVYRAFANKPGFYLESFQEYNDDNLYRFKITGNLRAIKEWYTFNPNPSNLFNSIGYALQTLAKEKAPLAIGPISQFHNEKLNIIIGKADDLNHIWASFYLGGISRGLSHELIRHKYQTAISQRSTRYVDESESEWAWHPLILQYQETLEGFPERFENNFRSCKQICQEEYQKIYNKLVGKNIDRKSARGAARGILGNALSTELIFSASLAEWKRIILMRSRDEADAEIRLMTNKIFHILQEKWPSHFYNLTSRPAKDGIGEHIEQF